MSKVVTIIARTEAKPNRIHLVKTLLLKLIEHTRNEEGCLNCDLHQDVKKPKIFVVYQNWESHELWQRHMNNVHLETFKHEALGSLEYVGYNEIKQIA